MIHYSFARLAFPLHQLSSGEPLSWAGLSSDYLPLTKELFVFTGAVQRAESRARQPGPGEKETLALKPAGRVGWKGRSTFQDTVCLSHNAPCEWNGPLYETIRVSTKVYSFDFVLVCVCVREKGPLWRGLWPTLTHMVTASEHVMVKSGSACGRTGTQRHTSKQMTCAVLFIY